ncbi:hypothetical protein [Microcoleus sp. Z1_C3]|uniref:hypothetical protein n=1 Tax=Microcoleus sp. Z1_C3 TaxID=3055431 RepID=UPI002FD2A9AD
MQSDLPYPILETKYPPSLMLEPLNTKLLDGEFAYSEAGVVSLKEVNIFRPPKVCLAVDTALESELLKLLATLFISLILISPIYQFALFLLHCHPQSHGIYIRRVLPDFRQTRNYRSIRYPVGDTTFKQ